MKASLDDIDLSPKSRRNFSRQLATTVAAAIGDWPRLDDVANGSASVDRPSAANGVAGFEAAISVVIPVIFGLIAVLGFVGNLLVIVVMVTANRKRRSTTNILLIGLSMADLAFIVMCVPFTAVNYALTVWPFGTLWCKVYQYVIHVTAHASVYTLVLMSVDRYLAVVHPICSLTVRTGKNACLLLTAVWLLIITGNAPLLGDFKVVVVDYDTTGGNLTICVHTHSIAPGSYDGRVYQTTFFAFAYVVPLTVICLLYGCLVYRLLRSGSENLAAAGAGGKTATARCIQQAASGASAGLGQGGIGNGGRPSEAMRARRRVTRMVIVVVAVFAACWLPYHVASMVQAFADDASPVIDSLMFAGFKIASNCVAYLNSCLNPLLYAFLSDNFRTGFAQTCAGGGAWPSTAAATGPGGRCARHQRKQHRHGGVVDRIAVAESDRAGTTGGWFRMVRRRPRPDDHVASAVGLRRVGASVDDDIAARVGQTSAVDGRSRSTSTVRLPGSSGLMAATSIMTLTERTVDLGPEVPTAASPTCA